MLSFLLCHINLLHGSAIAVMGSDGDRIGEGEETRFVAAKD
ncbi:hypothetical protein PJF56_19770 [Roseofilum sp. BLCC_M91]|uniref:Uncharacterized protein n=1 Tax=Roseofilum halophilum BLCC-M91 TaxID=3022259 RepID=A0ABT7BS37_9CYAN|nr:hypothetical protein [Roseofilum halophilum]MDJ1181103.1 hypothetical protein [Roseofilum halophilum BLCC-M91]